MKNNSPRGTYKILYHVSGTELVHEFTGVCENFTGTRGCVFRDDEGIYLVIPFGNIVEMIPM